MKHIFINFFDVIVRQGTRNFIQSEKNIALKFPCEESY